MFQLIKTKGDCTNWEHLLWIQSIRQWQKSIIKLNQHALVATMADKLTHEILTNGTIIPEDALGFVCPYFDKTLNLFTKLNFKNCYCSLDVMKIDSTSWWSRIFRARAIEEFDLSVRSYNCLKRAGISRCLRFDWKSKQKWWKFAQLGT